MVEDRRSKPFVSEAAELLKWMLQRMSVPLEKVMFDYILKCYATRCPTISKKADRYDFIQSCSIYRFATLQTCRPREIIGMGSICCEAFLGYKKVSDFEGTSWTPLEPAVRDYVERVWITYSPAYALEAPAEAVAIYRTVWSAAEAAGLKPRLNRMMKPFPFKI